MDADGTPAEVPGAIWLIRLAPMTSTKPTVDRPTGDAPTDLEIVDLAMGEGDEAMPGHTVVVHYVGVSFSSGKEFDSSWNHKSPFSFRLGAGEVITGWDQGVAGMRVGGRRRLTIPSKLAYGDRGAGGVIKPGETLIFVIDLLGVR
jgi:peptidylprolyl isomerase